MKKILALMVFVFSTIHAQAGNITGINTKQLRTGDVHLSDIPDMILKMIEFCLAIAGTVSVIFIIIGAYQILMGAYSGGSQKGKGTIMAAMVGFIISVSAWFILRFVVVSFI